MIALTIPLRTVSEANRASSEHWRVRHKRAKSQRETARAFTLIQVGHLGTIYRKWPAVTLTVTLTRISPRVLDDDNLASSQKHVRDGVADALGIDDRDPRVTWDYAQEKGKPGFYGVRIEIRRAA